jgi:hypothetical protein
MAIPSLERQRQGDHYEVETLEERRNKKRREGWGVRGREGREGGREEGRTKVTWCIIPLGNAETGSRSRMPGAGGYCCIDDRYGVSF